MEAALKAKPKIRYYLSKFDSTKLKSKEEKEHSQFVYALMYYRTPILIVSLIILLIIISGLFIAYCDSTINISEIMKQFNGPEYADLSDEEKSKLIFGAIWDTYQAADPPISAGGILGVLVDKDGWIDQIIGDRNIQSYIDMLQIKANESGSFLIGGIQTGEEFGNIVLSINDIFKTLGWGLALIFWGYSFMEMLMQSNGQLIVEQLIKKILFLVITYFVIVNSFKLCCEITNCGTWFLNEVGIIEGGDNGLSAIVGDFKKEIFVKNYHLPGGFIDLSWFMTNISAIGDFVTLLLPWIITKICGIILSVICWSRAIEIIIFATISPIMFIDLGTTRDLTHSSTARAVKNLGALALQGVIIIIALTICQSIMFGILNSTEGFGNKIWSITLVSILQIGTLAKSNSLIKQAFGIG